MCIAVVVLCLLAAGIAAVLHGNTLVEWWKPVTACFAISVPAALPLKQVGAALTGLKKGIVNYGIGLAISFSICMGLFYSVNYYASDSESVQDVTAEIVNRYSEERQKIRHVSRHIMVRGEKYHVYFMVAKLPDGRLKKIEITADRYRRIHIGQKLDLTIETGYFNIPVIKNLPVAVRNTH